MSHVFQLIMRSKNPRDVAYIFKEYAQKIHAKCTADDPSFIKIAAVCGRVCYTPAPT